MTSTHRAFASGELLDGCRVSGTASARWTIDGRSYVNFAGCGYLALGGLAQVRDAARQVIEQGAPFSQQLSPAYGARDVLFEGVEHAGARALNTETSIYFASGYQIGMVCLATFADSALRLFLDEGAHYNLKSAALASPFPVSEFAFADPQALGDAIKRDLRHGERPLVLTDGVFATSGELAPLPAYAQILAPYDGRLLIDDAHGFGVLGANGRGVAEFLGVEEIALVGTTLSKAYCTQGALVGCSHQQAARARLMPPIRGANAGSSVSAAASCAALSYMQTHPERRRRLGLLTQTLRHGLNELGFNVSASPSPIVSFQFGRRPEMRALQRKMFQAGFLLPISNYLGSGPEGTFRLSVFADHDENDFKELFAMLR